MDGRFFGKEKLAKDLESVVNDARDLASETISQAGTTATDTARRGAELTNRYIRSNLWKVLSAVAVIGIVTGALLGRR